MNREQMSLALGTLILLGLIGMTGCEPPQEGNLLKNSSYEGNGSLHYPTRPHEKKIKETSSREKQRCYHNLCLRKNMAEISGDFLMWKTEISGLTSGVRGNVADPLNPRVYPVQFDYKWEPGFRIGLAYRLGWHDCWQLSTNWTHFTGRGTSKAKVSADENEVLTASSIAFQSNGANEYEYRQTTHYDTIDLNLGTQFYPARFMSLTPFAGLRTALIDQRVRAEVDSFIKSGSVIVPIGTTHISAKSDFTGVGIRGGSLFQMYFSNNWSLIGNATAALMRGRFRIKESSFAPEAAASTKLTVRTNVEALEHMWRNQLNFEGGLGIEWRLCFNRNRSEVRLRGLYEMSYWPTMNRFFQTFGIPNANNTNALTSPYDDDFSVQGFAFSAAMTF